MSEIEKMYKNAGLSNMWVERYNDGYYEHENYYDSYKEMINNMMKVNNWTLAEAQETAKRECSKEFPPFTAKKQLKLIEFFISSIWWENLKSLYRVIDNSLNFEDKLAGIVNYLWLSLAEEEKQQVKGILSNE